MCSHSYWTYPILTPIAAVSAPNVTYLPPSGPVSMVVVPEQSATETSFLIWNGTNWVTSALTAPPNVLANYWMNLQPPSTVTANYGSVTPGMLPDAWITPVLSDTVNNRFVVAGLIGTIPTLVLYSTTLMNLASIPISGTPEHIAYDGTYIVVAGQSVPGSYYLSIYTVSGTTISLLKTYTYGVEVTSLELKYVDTVTPGVTYPHTILTVTTARYYLPGEVVTIPAPVITLQVAPPGDLFVYDLHTPNTIPQMTQPPTLLASYRYGGLLSASYSRRMAAIFALNDNGTVISFSALWRDNGLMLRLAPTSVSTSGAEGVYVVDNVGSTTLLVYGVDMVVAYRVDKVDW